MDNDERTILKIGSPWPRILLLTVVTFGGIVAFEYRNIETGWGSDATDLLFTIGVKLAAGAVGIVVMVAVTDWGKRLHITTRRILVVQGIFKKRIEQMRLDQIEKSEFDGQNLTFWGAGNCLEFKLERRAATADLQRTLGKWFPWSGSVWAPLETLLHPGEAVSFSYPPKWMDRGALFLVPLAAAPLLYGVYALGSGTGELFHAALYIVVGAALLIFLRSGLKNRTGWIVAVSDRRVMVRREHDPSRYDELPLDGIELVQKKFENAEVLLRSGSRDVLVEWGRQESRKRFIEALGLTAD